MATVLHDMDGRWPECYITCYMMDGRWPQLHNMDGYMTWMVGGQSVT